MEKDPDRKHPFLSNRLFRTNDDGYLFYEEISAAGFTDKDYGALD